MGNIGNILVFRTWGKPSKISLVYSVREEDLEGRSRDEGNS